jgi:hypothetical protein
VPVEHRRDGTDRRRAQVRKTPQQFGANSQGTPAGVLGLELHEQRLELKGQAIGLPTWSLGSVR